jgi:hypothetical protein
LGQKGFVVASSIKKWRIKLIMTYIPKMELAIEASGFGVPLRAASCCSSALDSKYSSQAAASCVKYGYQFPCAIRNANT